MFRIDVIPYTLNFSFSAGTSRGVLNEKLSIFLKLYDQTSPQNFALGEAAPLPGLSPDFSPDYITQLKTRIQGLQHLIAPGPLAFQQALASVSATESALKFALETALHDFNNGCKREIYKTGFSVGQEKIPINGLVWMGDANFMNKQIAQKLDAGFTCLKLKVGAIDFETECQILKNIRHEFNEETLVLRVDANGAWPAHTALSYLNVLSEFKLHSIEQPIQPKQWEQMAYLCEQSPIQIALDEELIFAYSKAEKINLLETIKPNYIVLKPTLHGGLTGSQEWIELAQARSMGWWITSALESNIGLNAICQFTSITQASGFQGLGTGQLYTNNIESPLEVLQGYIGLNSNKNWNLSLFE